MASDPRTEPIAESIRATIAGTNGHVVFRAKEVAELLSEHDALAAEADQLALAVSDQSKRARECEASAHQWKAGRDTWQQKALEMEADRNRLADELTIQTLRTEDAVAAIERVRALCETAGLGRSVRVYELAGAIAGVPVREHFTDAPLPAGVDWSATDEADYQRRRAAGFPAAAYDDPPFTPVRVAQFVSGFQATTHAMEADR